MRSKQMRNAVAIAFHGPFYGRFASASPPGLREDDSERRASPCCATLSVGQRGCQTSPSLNRPALACSSPVFLVVIRYERREIRLRPSAPRSIDGPFVTVDLGRIAHW